MLKDYFCNKKDLNIVLVHDALINRGGAERVFQVFCEMFPNAPIYTSVYFPNRTLPYFKKRLVHTTFLQKLISNEMQLKSLFPLANYLMQKIRLDKYDIILSSSTFCGKYISSKNAKHICYCYTPFRLIWNIDSYNHSNKNSIKITTIKPFLPFLKKWDLYAANKVNQFIAMTRETSIRIQKAYNKNTAIVPPPIDMKKYEYINETCDYFLVVSRLEPYKKVDLVVKAFNKINLNLKIIGNGTLSNYLKKIANNNIEFFHNISDEKLKSFYQKCIAVIFPQKEDYGLVPLEANACGTPVICYGKGGVETTMIPYSKENKSRATALFFDDQTVESLMLAIKCFEKIEFNQKALVENAKRFDVDIFKNKILKVIENIRK